ncbi:MAG: S8/S53 family peptidase [Ferruginibacter sp.]
MPQLKVVVPLLNKRTAPVENTGDTRNVVGKVNDKFEFESVEEKTNSQGTWYKDKNGNWYWGGGVEIVDEQIVGAENILDYNSKSSLPNEVKNTKGKNITVAIVDTGCFSHDAFKNISIKGKNFIDNNDIYDDTSSQSHGTFISGIISAGKCNGFTMEGVAPNVMLVIAKIASQTGISDRDALLEGLKWVLKQKPDIINCSFDFSPSADANNFRDIFLSEEAKKIIWVAAGQDNNGLFNNTIYYPGSEQNYIAVGSLNKDVLSNHNFNQINKKIKYLVQETAFISTDRFDSYSSGIGSSFATAIVAGNFALVKSFLMEKNKRDISPKECIDFLDNHLEQLSSIKQLDSKFIILKM